jgi:serine/threonine protein kinase
LGCNTKADVWSLGVLAFTTVAGYLPYGDARTFREFQAMKVRITENQKSDPRFFSREFRAFLNRALATDPAARASAKDLLDDPWILGVKLPSPSGQS